MKKIKCILCVIYIALAIMYPFNAYAAPIHKKNVEILACNDLPQYIVEGLKEINKPIDGGFTWKIDRWMLAYSVRTSALIEQYGAACNPHPSLDPATCKWIFDNMQIQFGRAISNRKDEITRSAYAKRARTNAAALVYGCPNVFTFEKSVCKKFKEEARKELVTSMRTAKGDLMTLHGSRSSLYMYLFEHFCE